MADRRDENGNVAPPERPQLPRYGELAPEGWTWSPEDADAAETKETGSRPAASGAPRAGSPSGPGRGQLPGVPHNLGVGEGSGSAPAPTRVADTATPGGPSRQPYRASEPQRGEPGGVLRAAPAQPRGRTGDRTATILLLVLGALGALYLAASLQQMPESLAQIASLSGLDGFGVPSSVHTLGTVGAIAVLAIYAVNLIYAIQRLRHARLAFWVPLVAGAVAVIVVFAFSAFGMSQSPELMQHLMTDPDAMNTLLENLAEPGGQ